MVTNDGLWDWDRIGSSLSRIALDRIASVPPPRAGLGGDFPRGRELGTGSSAFYLPPEGTTSLVIQEQGASGVVPGMHARGAPVISGAAVGIG
ncbi:hypothetical protein V6N13_080079 [Hibiscus sabdariffa]